MHKVWNTSQCCKSNTKVGFYAGVDVQAFDGETKGNKGKGS